MASGARGAPEITPAEKEAIDGIRDFLAVEFEGAQNVPDSRILEALKNYGMDRTRAHEELCVELSRSSWDTVPTKEKKRTDNKREGNQDDSSAPSGRGRGRGSGPGRGGGRGESWGDQGSRGPGGRGGRWETAGDRPRGGGAGPGGDRGRGSRGRGGPGPGPPRPVQPRPGNFEGGVAPGPQVPRASGPPPAEVHKPPPQPPAAAPAPVLDAPIPQNQWSKGRPRTEEPPKPAEPPVPPSAAMPQWASMPQSAQELQSAGSDLGGQLSSVPAGGMQGMMGATSAQANAAAVSSSVGTNGGASAAAARGADVMQQFRAQPSPDALASNFSSLGFGDGGAGMPRSPQKPAADSMAQAQAAVQPQDMSAFSDPAQSSSLFPQYGQVSGGASAVPAQSQHQFQQQAAAPSQAAPQAAQVPAQAQDNVYDSSGKDEAQTYGMAGMGADTSASQAAQQQAYNRMGYAGTAAQAAAGTATKQPAAGQAGYGQPAAGVEGGMGQAGMQPQQMAQQQQQQLSWQQQQQAQQQQQSMMHWANTSAYGWGDPRMFQQMYMMGYGTQVPMQMYNQNYQQTQPNPMAGGGHAGKQGFNAQSGKKNQQQSQQNQQYGSTPGYGSGYGGGSGFPGYGDMSSGGSQDYYKSQAAAAGGYGGMYPMFNGMPMEGMGGYGMGGQTAGQAATSSTMRGYAPMGGASAGATGMQGMDPSMSNAGGSYLGQGGGLDDQKSSWGAGGQ